MKNESLNTDFEELVGMKVLLAEEAPSDIDILRRILEGQGLNISMAPEGEVLFNVVPRVRPDLILLDAHMPDVDGYEACRQLKGDSVTRNIPVLIIQARNGSKSIGKVFSAGAADYINKPYRVEEILARVKHQLQIQKLLKEKQRMVDELNLKKGVPPTAESGDQKTIPENLKWEALRSQKENVPFCVLMSNIDDFSTIKKKFGARAQGHLLNEVQNMLKGKCRRLDKVTVWGMEEFLVLLPGTEMKGGVVLAEKYQAHLQSSHFDLEDGQVRLTMSFGISQFDPENENDERAVAQTVMRAKESLGKVKSSGKSNAISIG